MDHMTQLLLVFCGVAVAFVAGMILGDKWAVAETTEKLTTKQCPKCKGKGRVKR